MVEGLLRLAENTFRDKTMDGSQPFMMRSSSKSQGNKKKKSF
jgi:hypothetical protein